MLRLTESLRASESASRRAKAQPWSERDERGARVEYATMRNQERGATNRATVHQPTIGPTK